MHKWHRYNTYKLNNYCAGRLFFMTPGRPYLCYNVSAIRCMLIISPTFQIVSSIIIQGILIVGLFSLSVPASFLTMGTAVVGEGTLITCSWQYLPSPMTFVLIMHPTGLDYQFDREMGDNRGMGLLADTVGWLGEDKFFVYINVTEKRQIATYECIVGTAGDTFRSNSFELNVAGKNTLHCEDEEDNMLYYSILWIWRSTLRLRESR